jgi:hypothetical protein
VKRVSGRANRTVPSAVTSGWVRGGFEVRSCTLERFPNMSPTIVSVQLRRWAGERDDGRKERVSGSNGKMELWRTVLGDGSRKSALDEDEDEDEGEGSRRAIAWTVICGLSNTC